MSTAKETFSFIRDYRVRDLKQWLAEAEPFYAGSDKQRGQRSLPRP